MTHQNVIKSWNLYDITTNNGLFCGVTCDNVKDFKHDGLNDVPIV